MNIVRFLFVAIISVSFLFSQEQKDSPSKTEEAYFIAVEELPEPIGGMAAIQSNVIYPEIARRAGIQGTVFVEVFIDEKGDVVKTIVKQAIGSGCDEAAQRAVEAVRFKPGRQQGKPVKVRLAIPIRFRLGPVTKTAEEMKKLKQSITKPTVLVAAGPRELAREIEYPEEAIRNQVEGMVYIQVLLRQDKLVKGITLKDGVTYGIDREVMRAVQSYDFTKDPNFSQTKNDTTFTILVQFILPQKQ